MAGLSAYAYLNAKLRAKLGKLLSDEEYDRLTRAADLEAAYETMRHTEYADVFKSVPTAQSLRQAESALVERLISCHREVADHCKGSVREFVQELMRKYEVENLKVILRLWNAKEASEFIYRGRTSYDIPVDSILQASTIEEIIVLLDDTPYKKPLREAREDYKKTASVFSLENALDRELYEAMWRVVERLSSPDRKIAARLMGIEIDILNINSILRFKRYYNLGLEEITSLMIPNGYQISREFVRKVYPGRDQASLISELLAGVYKGVPQLARSEEETRALHLLEALLREVFAQQVRKVLGGFPFTIGVVIAYLRLKKMELSNIITILNAKALHLPREEIESNVVNL